MSAVKDHPDIEKLPLEVDGIPVRETIREIFRNPENGTPDNISKAGCLALAEHSVVVWNCWRHTFPSLVFDNSLIGLENKANFAGCDFDPKKITLQIRRDFRYFVFENMASFELAKFGAVLFDGAKFGFGADFRRALFSNEAGFSDVFFGGSASFRNAKFGSVTDFYGARFNGAVDFSVDADNAKEEEGEFSFERTVFAGIVNFNGRRFSGSTIFRNAKFTHSPPTFHGCELHQDTSFEGAQFPPATGSEEAARAYRTLKLAFSKQQAIREEQRFFRLEMDEERVGHRIKGRDAINKSQPFVALREYGTWLLYWLYKQTSDYGFSIARPLLLLAILWLIFAQKYGSYTSVESCYTLAVNCTAQSDWLNYSLQQALPLPGFDKLEHVVKGVSVAWLFIHKTLSLATLFLIGLALRNLFKLK